MSVTDLRSSPVPAVSNGGVLAFLGLWRNAAIVIAVIFAAWQGLHLYAGESAITSPAETLATTARLLGTASFWADIKESMIAFLSALACAVVIGLTLGFWLGFHKLSGEVFSPILIGIASVPKITLYPIILLVFGLGMSAKVAFGALHGIVPIALFTIGALGTLKPVYLRLGRVGQLNGWQTVRYLLLPAALPEIFTGLRIGFSLTLIGTILGEMFAAQKGLGFQLMSAIGLHNVPMIMAITFLLTVFAAVFSSILLNIDRRIRRRMA